MPDTCLQTLRERGADASADCCFHMQQLSVMQQQAGNEEAFEYNSLLRHGIFEAYSGILNGMSSAKCDQYLQPSAPVRLCCNMRVP